MKAENSITEILKLHTPQISTINYGRDNRLAGVLIFKTAILGIINYFGVDWNELQLQECADLAFSEYFWFQLAELKHFTVKMKMGHYSEVYGFSKINPEKMLVCMSDYSHELLYVRAQQKYDTPKIANPEIPMTEEEKNRQEKYFETLKNFRIEFTEQIKLDKETEEREEERKLKEKQTQVIQQYAAQQNIGFEEAKALLTKK